MMIDLDALRATPNALAHHYSRFGVADKLLLTGHSHQAWPDVAAEGQLAALADAATYADAKWDAAFAKADRLRAGVRRLMADPSAEIALGANTHELVIRFLSALNLVACPRLVTTDGEFHTLRRQLARLGEAGIELVRVPAEPVATLSERMAAAVDDRTAAVLVSAVLFETSRIVPGLADLAGVCARYGAELLVDAYHALGVVPFDVPAAGLTDAWVVGGGYKYLQLGEGNCFLRLPAHAERLRPVITGWYAEFAELSLAPGETVGYGPGAIRFAGATYDPTSHYRAASVLDFFDSVFSDGADLSVPLLRQVSQHQTTLLAQRFDALGAPDGLVTRDRATPRSEFGGFLSLRSPHAGELCVALAERGVRTDSRGEHLRFGPAPYLSDRQLTDAMAALGEIITAWPDDAGR